MQIENKLIPISLTGDLRRGGYTLTARIDGDTDAVSNGQNWQLMAKSGATFRDAEWREIFNGHLAAAPDNLQVSRYGSSAQGRAGTMQELMSGESLQDIGFTAQASPANDHQIVAMQMGDIEDHIIRRHCNVVYDATAMPDGVITSVDIDTTNSTQLTRYNVRKSTNLWRSLQQIGGGEDAGEFYRCWFDRSNTFHYQPAPVFWSTPPTSKGTLTKAHLKSLLRVKLNNNQPGARIGQVTITAIKDFSTVYTSTYPTNAADGKILPARDGVWAQSQARADTLAQRLFQWRTRSYTVTVEVDPGLVLFGDDGDGLDLADKVTLTYDGPTEDAATGHGFHINFSAQSFFVYGIQINFDKTGKAAKAILTLEQDPT